jgi:hypothetical protein
VGLLEPSSSVLTTKPSPTEVEGMFLFFFGEVVPPFVIILKKNPTMVQNEIVAEHATFLLRFAHEQTLSSVELQI